jgi:formylglycine-generating enzyme required for sulfatase activity
VKLEPPVGLVPLHRDPRSGLWEFWHVLTGDRPEIDPATDRWRMTAETGIVLVLLPGGTVTLGSKPMPDPNARAPFLDPGHQPDQPFVENLALDPFFVSKYETTQAQAVRLMGEVLSTQAESSGPQESPAIGQSMEEVRRAARRADLSIPTEAQWEYACRGGTDSPFFTGWTYRSLEGYANTADRTAIEAGEIDPDDAVAIIFDGYARLAPVGSFEPNPFGLHDVHGNVWELTRDAYVKGRDISKLMRAGDGLHGDSENPTDVSIRGGSYFAAPWEARSPNRMNWSASARDGDIGMRFVRSLESR